VVIVDQHEPEGEAAGRLLEIAEEKGYSPRVVEAQRGEHDAALSFRVPADVADAFNAARSDLWPDDSAKRAELGAVAVDGTRREKTGPDDESMIENDTEKAPASSDTTPPAKKRTGKATEE
jgi:hypothetical protein